MGRTTGAVGFSPDAAGKWADDRIEVDPRSYGAKADVWCFNNGAISAATPNLVTLGTTGWLPSAVRIGNPIILRGAGAAGADLITTITGIVGTNAITFATAAAGGNMTNITGKFGTDDSAAINAALAVNGFLSPWSTVTYGTLERNTGNGGVWQHGPRTVVLKSRGRNGSIFGILSPIRLSSGCHLRFHTPVHVLPGFDNSKGAPLDCILDGSGLATIDVFFARVTEPWIVCDGLSERGIWFRRGVGFRVEGDVNVFGAVKRYVQLGSDTQADAYDRIIVSTFGGKVYAQNRAGTPADAFLANDDDSVGVYCSPYAYDNTFSGEVEVLGCRVGVWDRGGNTHFNSKVHVWTGKNMGFMQTGVRAAGEGFHFSRIFVDSLCAANGTDTYGVDISKAGTIGAIDSTVNSSVGTLDNQCTLVRNTYSGVRGVHIASVLAKMVSGSAAVKFKAVVADTTGNLRIGQLDTDGNYYALGYQTEAALRLVGDANLQSQVTAIAAITPGAPWTPAQIPAAQMPVWLDAAQASSLSLDGSNKVTSWASRSGAITATVASSSTAPTWGAAAFGTGLPGVTFDGVPSGNMLDLGASTALGSGITDIACFMVVKRLTQDTTDATTQRRNMALLVANNGSSSFQSELAFQPHEQDGLHNKIDVRTIGGGTLSITGPGDNVKGIVEGFWCSNGQPNPQSSINGPAGTAFVANVQNNAPGIGSTFSLGATAQRNFLGGSNINIARRAAMVLCEMIVVTGPLAYDATIRAKIEGYLAAKWFGAATAILPSTHSYYLTAPAVATGLANADVTSFVQIADKTVANTTTATSLVGSGVGSLSVAANSLIVGKSYRMRMAGTFGTTGTPGNLTVSLKIGSVTLGSAVLQALPASATTNGWEAEFIVSCRTNGAAGTLVAGGSVEHDNGTGRGGASLNPTGAAATVDTTAAASFDVLATWATANASNTITTKLATVEALN